MHSAAQRLLAVAAAAILLIGTSRPATADEPTPADLSDRSVAVWRIDALGIDDEIVTRLETLFRMELARLVGKPLPSPRQVQRTIGSSARLNRCTGEPKCLAAIGKRLDVELIVSGSVAQLGETYVVNLKLVDVATRTELRRISSDPLKGTADELIEGVRVAAYRLLAPDHLLGSIAVLTDLIGAEVRLDGQLVGATPLEGAISNLPLGNHTLRVTAKNYSPFDETVLVRFQKTSRVVVRLIRADAPAAPLVTTVPMQAPLPPARDHRWYRSTWFYVGVGVAAVVVGGFVGNRIGADKVIDCNAGGAMCQ